MKQIVIVTDCCDVAYNEIRASIITELGKNNKDFQIEPVVKVKERSVLNCAFLIRLLAESYPAGTTFMVLCSPTKEKPSRIYGITKKKKLRFFGTNNGVLSWFLKDFETQKIYEMKNRKDAEYLPFGGKNDYAPRIAKLARSKKIRLNKKDKKIESHQIKKITIPKGIIVHIDNFGLCKINLRPPKAKAGQKFMIRVNNKSFFAYFCKRMMSLPDKTIAIYPGSSMNLLELGGVRMDLTKKINLKIGDIVNIKKYENSNKH